MNFYCITSIVVDQQLDSLSAIQWLSSVKTAENNLMLIEEVNIYKIQIDDLHDMSVKNIVTT